MTRIHDPHFAVGMTVYDTVGYTVGTLRAYHAQGAYLTVRPGWRGWPFHRADRYIPVGAVDPGPTRGVSLPRDGPTRDISLLLSRDDLTADQYNAPPSRGTLGTGGDG